MKSYFECELKRCFFAKESFFAMCIILISLIIPYFNELKVAYPEADSLIYFIRVRTCLMTSYFPLIAPLVACIPSATKYISDKKSRMINNILLKIERKKYFRIRVVVNFLVSGLVILIPQLCMLTFLLLKYGVNNTTMDVFGAFSYIFSYSKLLYVIILLILSFISSAVYSSFALGISAIVENKYLTMLIPFVYIIISGTIFEIMGINQIFPLNIMILFDPSYNGNLTFLNILIYLIILLFTGITLFFYFGEKNNYE